MVIQQRHKQEYILQADPARLLADTIKRLMRRKANTALKKIVSKTHAADLSLIFYSLSNAEQRKLFDMIDDVEQKGVLFSELDEDLFLSLAKNIPLEDLVVIFKEMPTDDAADLIDQLPPETARAILRRMDDEGSEEIEGLLRYDEDTAGGDSVLQQLQPNILGQPFGHDARTHDSGQEERGSHELGSNCTMIYRHVGAISVRSCSTRPRRMQTKRTVGTVLTVSVCPRLRTGRSLVC